tara:strand:+ start:131873 stop:132172 length:300 start_codon:yes stop_codon:yes gene_type:complete
MPNETRKIEPGDRCYQHKDRIVFDCPGCGHHHSIVLGRWTFNNNFRKPTFEPSVLVRSTFGPERVDRRCHSFVKKGKIQYLSDCTHKLAGKTVDLPEID